MKLRVLLTGLMFALPVALSAQNPQMDARRHALQGQIIQNFLNRASVELQLDAASRAKLEDQLRQSGEQRRALAQNTALLRRQMMDAALDSTTSDAQFRKLLADMTALRQKEEDLWKSDQDGLARILTPRQHARFVFLWLRFNDQVREMALQRPRPRP